MGSKEEEVEEERKIHHPLEFLIFSGLNVYPSEPPNLNLAVGPSPPRWLQPFTMPLGRPPNSTEQVIVSCLSAELGWGYSHPSWNPVNPHAFSHWRVWHHSSLRRHNSWQRNENPGEAFETHDRWKQTCRWIFDETEWTVFNRKTDSVIGRRRFHFCNHPSTFRINVQKMLERLFTKTLIVVASEGSSGWPYFLFSGFSKSPVPLLLPH